MRIQLRQNARNRPMLRMRNRQTQRAASQRLKREANRRAKRPAARFGGAEGLRRKLFFLLRFRPGCGTLYVNNDMLCRFVIK